MSLLENNIPHIHKKEHHLDLLKAVVGSHVVSAVSKVRVGGAGGRSM